MDSSKLTFPDSRFFTMVSSSAKADSKAIFSTGEGADAIVIRSKFIILSVPKEFMSGRFVSQPYSACSKQVWQLKPMIMNKVGWAVLMPLEYSGLHRDTA